MRDSNSEKSGLEILSNEEEGYHPMIMSGDWLVALMNWEPRFDLTGVGKIERHNETEEVFVLLHGKCVLFIKTSTGLSAFDMQPGVLYNVDRGTWHNVIGTQDAKWLIVEAKNTAVDNSNYDQLSGEEIQALKAQYPDWLKRLSQD